MSADTEPRPWVDRVRRYLLALYPQRAETGSTKTGQLIAQSEPIALPQFDGKEA